MPTATGTSRLTRLPAVVLVVARLPASAAAVAAASPASVTTVTPRVSLGKSIHALFGASSLWPIANYVACSATEKHAGGNTEGEAEKRDEEAGEAIAKTDEKVAATEDATPEEEAEPEEKLVSYDEYLAQQAEKKLAIETDLSVRQANEGTKSNKQWAAAKPLVKEEDEEFIASAGGKAKRERERKVKQVVEIDQRFVEQPERTTRGGFRGGRGGRGGDRGDRSERPERGDRGDRAERDDRAERGEFRGGRGGPRGGPRGGARGRGEPRGAPRGGAPRGGAPRGAPRGGANLNPKDESAFPSLGS